MQIIRQFGWVYYVGETADQLDEHKCGKWMYFFGDVEFAKKICKAAVENGVVAESKHSDAPEGVCCFYSMVMMLKPIKGQFNSSWRTI